MDPNCVVGLDNDLISEDEFGNALYMIDIGQNDIADSFAKNMSFAQVVKRIPSVTTEIRNAIEVRQELLPSKLMVIYFIACY